MSVLNRKLRRDLKSSWLLLTAVTSILAVGVSCYVTMRSAYNNLNEAKRRYYRQCRMADFSIDLKKVPLAEIEPIARLPGIGSIRPRVRFNALVDLPEVPEPINAMILSLPDRREPVINDIVMREGAYFSERRQNEVIVNEAFAKEHNLKPGGWIRLVLNNRLQELQIVGTAISSEFVYLLGPGTIVPDSEHYGVFYLKQSYAEDVFDFDGAANQLVGRLTPGTGPECRPLLDRAERMLAPYGVFSATPLADQASNKYLTQEIEGLRSFGIFLPCVFFAVAALVLNVLLSRLAEQERITIGTLKALGYSDRQVFLHFLKFGLTVGMVGGVIGCAIGYVLANLLTILYRDYFVFPDLNNQVYPGLQATAIAISLFCAVLGSLRGARTVLRLKPAEAMRPKPPKKGGAVLLERITWIWSRLSSGWRMVFRGVLRNRVRTLAGIFATAMGSGVLVCGFMMLEASVYLIDFQFKSLWKSDMDLSFKDLQSEDALFEAARLPGVDRAEPTLNVAGTFINGPWRKKGGILGLVPNARLTVPRDTDAMPIRIPRSGIALSRKLAQLLHVEPGDVITFEPVQGHKTPRSVRVVEISESYLGTVVYADIHYLSRLVDEEMAISGVQLDLDNDPNHRRSLDRQLKRMPAVEAVNTRASMVEKLEETLVENMWVSIAFLVLFAGVVFFGSILNASLVSLAERQREVATLRVLGYGPWQIGSLLLRESLIVTAVGTLVGMPFGYLLSVAASRAYDTEMFRFPIVSSAATWFWTALLALIFALTAHLVVQRTIHTMDWLEAIKAKE